MSHRRSAYYADTHSVEAALRHEIAVQYKNAFDNFGQFAMQDFAFHSPAAQPGRYFEGGGKRVLHTVCQDDGRAGKSLEMLDNQPFHFAGGDEQMLKSSGDSLLISW